MDRRRLRTFFARSNVEGDVSSVIQFFEREALQRVFVKLHLAASFLEDESVSLLREQFADHASKWKDRGCAYFSARPPLAVLAEYDGHRVEGCSDSLSEGLVFFARRHGLTTWEGYDDERLGDVG